MDLGGMQLSPITMPPPSISGFSVFLLEGTLALVGPSRTAEQGWWRGQGYQALTSSLASTDMFGS